MILQNKLITLIGTLVGHFMSVMSDGICSKKLTAQFEENRWQRLKRECSSSLGWGKNLKQAYQVYHLKTINDQGWAVFNDQGWAIIILV